MNEDISTFKEDSLDTYELILEAIESKAPLKVIYHGGSMRGQLRDVTPLSLRGDDIRARCHITNVVKTFKLPKIEVMDQDGVLTEALDKSMPSLPSLPNLLTLQELFNYMDNDLNFSQWHISFKRLSISLRRKFKNGKPLKASALSIYYDDIDFGLTIDSDPSESFQVYKKNKPWSFHSELGSTNFKYLDKAIAKFLLHAQKISPKRN